MSISRKCISLKRILRAGMLLLLLPGCVVAIPMHEIERSETLGGGVMRIQAVGIGETPFLDVEPEEYTEEDLTGSVGSKAGAITHSLTLGLADNLDLELEYSHSAQSNGFRGGLKYQWLGEHHYFDKIQDTLSSSIAVRFLSVSGGAWNSDTDRTVPDPWYVTNSTSVASFQISIPTGYRLSPWLSCFFGPRMATGSLKLDYRHDAQPGVNLMVKRNYTGFGYFYGLAIHPAGEKAGIELLVEGYRMQLPLDNRDEHGWYQGMHVGLAFVLAGTPPGKALRKHQSPK
ncbi:hypothetical protein ACFL3H_02085 [Gemmatimonadota bacterium]